MKEISTRIKKIMGGGPMVDFAAGFFATLGFFLASAVWSLVVQIHQGAEVPSEAVSALHGVHAEADPACRSE